MENKLFEFECFLKYDNSNTISSTVIAETYSKARYKFYKELDSDYSYAAYIQLITVKKLRPYDLQMTREYTAEEIVHFDQFKERRNIPFAKLGMQVNIVGKCGIIIGNNCSLNLDVDFGDGLKSNCHPYWEATYLNTDGSIIKDFKNQYTLCRL